MAALASTRPFVHRIAAIGLVAGLVVTMAPPAVADHGPNVSIDDVILAEGDGGGTTSFDFTITLTEPVGLLDPALTIGWETFAPGGLNDATAGVDYTAASGSVTFGGLAGETGTTATVSISVAADQIVEGDEVFGVALTIESGDGHITDGQGDGTIENDDATELSIDDVTVTEGDTGTATAEFTVTVTDPNPDPISVDYTTVTTVTDTATAGVDYTTASGTLNIPAFATSAEVAVDVTGDILVEGDETFKVNLSNATTGVTIDDGQGLGTISDDDAATLSIADASVAEGDAGQTNLVFTISTDKPSTSTIEVDWATGDHGTAENPATAGGDYTTSSGTATITASTHTTTNTSTTISVPIVGDTDVEPDETFTVTLSSPTSATIGDATATGTILTDDAEVTLSIADVSVNEQGPGVSEFATLFVIADNAPKEPVEITWSTADGADPTATADGDYEASGGTKTLEAGQTQVVIQVPVYGDDIDEFDETFQVTIAESSGWATIPDDTAVVTIVDDNVDDTDGPPTISIDDVTELLEGDPIDGAGPLDPDVTTKTFEFTVSLDGDTEKPVTFDWFTSDAGGPASATAGEDYVAGSGDDVVVSNSTSATVVVTVNMDTTEEQHEKFLVQLDGIVNAVPGGDDATDGTGEGVINNDETTISVADRGREEGTDIDFAPTLSFPVPSPVSYQWATSDGTATSTEPPEPTDDYTAGGSAGTPVVIPVDDTTSPYFLVSTIDDTVDESPETFTVTLSDVAASDPDITVTVGDGIASGTIVDNDVSPSVTMPADQDTTEEQASQKVVQVTVELTGNDTERTVTVDYATADGTATGADGTCTAADYQSTSGTLTFDPGDRSETFDLVICGDTVPEDDETVQILLTNATNVAGSNPADGIFTITNDDTSLVVDDASVAEGDTGDFPTVGVTVRLGDQAAGDVTFDWALVAGTATEGDDYPAGQSGTGTILAGQTQTTVTVTVTGDDTLEPNETLDLVVSNVVGAPVHDDTGRITVVDDEAGARVSVAPLDPVLEGDSGDVDLLYEVTLTDESGTPILAGDTITFDVTTGDAGDTATPDVGGVIPETNDYAPIEGDQYSIASGTSSTQIAVPVHGDADIEPFETVTVTLSNLNTGSTSATFGDTTAVNVIENDDYELSVTDVSAAEGTNAVFMVSIPQPVGFDVNFTTTTADGEASAPGDYTAHAAEAGTITEGSTSVAAPVVTVEDVTDEPDETFTITIGDNAKIADGSGTGTILDDDDPAVLDVVETSLNEGDSGTSSIEVTITVTPVSGKDIQVDWATVAGTATDGDDYPTGQGATLNLPAGTASTTVTFNATGDTIDESDETVLIDLTNPTNASVEEGPEGFVTILDDDETVVSIEDASVQEGNSGTTDLAFTVRLSGPSATDITVDYTTTDGTATAPGDYTATTNSVVIPAGATTGQAVVPVVGDTSVEPNETFTVTITGVTGATADPSGDTATGTILNDDASVSISDAAPVSEADAGTTSAVFTITLSHLRSSDVTVEYTTVDGTATADADYTTTAGTATIPGGQTTTEVMVPILDDAVFEGDETFTVVLSSPTNATLGDASGTGTVADDEAQPTLSVDDVTVGEAAGPATFTVSLSGTSAFDVTVDVVTSDGTAVAGSDYTAVSDTVTIPAGSTSATIDVPVTNDALDENDETFTLTLSNPSNATIADDTGTGTITDDDAAPTLSVDDVLVGEAEGPATFTLSLSGPSSFDVTVDVATADGTATAGSDYTAVSDTVTIPAGSTAATVDVPVTLDADDEGDETFTLDLSNPSNATIADASGTATIIDAGAPTLAVDDVTVQESSGPATFTVSLSETSSFDVTVDVATADVTAAAGSDYTAVSDTVTIPAGSISVTVDVPVTDDAVDENDETFTLDLSNPSNATIADASGTATITDDDEPPAPTNHAPTVEAGANRTVESTLLTNYEAAVSDPDNDPVTVTWTFGDGTTAVTGNPVSHAFDTSGVYQVEVVVTDGEGATGTDTFLVSVYDTGVVGRAAGTNRVLTSVAASQAFWPDGRAAAADTTVPATHALIASAATFPDALAAGPLAAKLDAPLLLSDRDALPAAVEDELARLGVGTVWLLGGPNSLSAGIEQRLEDLGYAVERRAGTNRFETAAAIATEVGANDDREVVLTLGDHADQSRAFPDALSAGSMSASPQRLPVLLTNMDAIPAVTENALAALGTEKIWIVGGVGSVSANVEARLHALGYQVERLSGTDRYATSIDVAQEALTRAPAGPVRLVFATGAAFPDGLAGGAVAARLDGILILVPNGPLPDGTRQFLETHAHRFDEGTILGGTSTLSDEVRNALRALLDA